MSMLTPLWLACRVEFLRFVGSIDMAISHLPTSIKSPRHAENPKFPHISPFLLASLARKGEQE